MKKLFLFLTALIFAWGATNAQCTIDHTNTTSGFTPDPPSAITQGTAYAQTVQVYVPTTYSYMGVPVTIDSVHISAITALPTGITYVFNPVDGNGGTVVAGGNGAICFSGTTTDTVGTYTLVFTGYAYTSLGAIPLSTLASSFHYAFTVIAQAPAASCDTLFNVSLATDTPVYSNWESPAVGYVSGSGGIPLQQGGAAVTTIAIGEKFTGTVGYYVNTAYVFPAYTTVNSTDSNLAVTLYLYNATGVDLLGHADGPGTALDSSITTLGELANAVTNGSAIAVNFPHQPALTAADFFIVLSLPQVNGDTVVVLTNTGDTYFGNGWLGTADGWLPYDSIIGGIVDLGNFIGAVACSSAKLPPLAAFTVTPASACLGASVSFNDNSTPSPLQVEWSFGDGSAVVSGTSQTHTFTAVGTYNVLEYSANANGATQAVKTVTVNANPTATTSQVSASAGSSDNGSAKVTAAGGSGTYTYAWAADGGTTDTINNVGPGTYIVTVTDGNGCSVVDTASVFATGIVNINNAGTVSVYPNPVTNALNLVWSQKSNSDVSVVDMNGNVIKTFTTVGESNSVIDVHTLASGSYILRFTDKTNNQQSSMVFNKF